jgi:ADP-heptose:LPS heptosyltransferase
MRQNFPEANITLVISETNEDLLPALRHVDRTLIIRRKLGDAKILDTIRREKFDYCIDLTRNDRSAFLTLLSRATKRIAASQRGRQSKLRDRTYTHFVEDRVQTLHTVDFYLSFLEPLGITGASTALELALPPEAIQAADSVIERARVDGPYVLFHPGAARAERFWPAERWAEIMAHTQSKWEMTPVLAGGTWPAEAAHLDEIKREAPAGVFDLSGQLDLLTLTALIAKARLAVTLDSAAMHLAAATATPQIALFGIGNPFHWRPRQPKALVLFGESTVPVTEFTPLHPRIPMDLISTANVIDGMDTLLAAPRDASV